MGGDVVLVMTVLMQLALFETPVAEEPLSVRLTYRILPRNVEKALKDHTLRVVENSVLQGFWRVSAALRTCPVI